MSESKPQKVVVVGAGASARLVIKNLKASKASVDITVIQPNKFASLPFYQTLVLTNRETLVGNSTFAEIEGADKTVYGTAVGCSDGLVAVQPLDKSAPVEVVPFDVVVCATGITFPVICETPGQSQAERQAEIDQYAKVLTSGENVVVAGGGAVGVELAGDILEKLPAESRKGKVTLISSSDRLLPTQAAKYGEQCKTVLEGLGCEIIFSDRVSSHSESAVSDGSPMTLTLKSGKTLSCSAYVAAYARGASTNWLAAPAPGGSKLAEGLLNEKGQVVVNDFMQSAAYEKMYAMGATSSRADMPSLFANIDVQAKTVAKNIVTPGSTKQGPGTPDAMYQLVGHETFATPMLENSPLPPFCATLCCTWCGFPCNMLCPCFCLGVLAGPCDAMMCGYCCSAPEGKGLANTLMGTKKAGMMAGNAGYAKGFGEEMERS